jgi:hypothetical protein
VQEFRHRHISILYKDIFLGGWASNIWRVRDITFFLKMYEDPGWEVELLPTLIGWLRVATSLQYFPEYLIILLINR